MKILIYDVETAPTLAYVWRMWKENISPNQIVEHGRVLCWAAKWYGDDEVLWMDARHEEDETEMLSHLHALIEEADAVVTYNGNNFDIPVVNTQFPLHLARASTCTARSSRASASPTTAWTLSVRPWAWAARRRRGASTSGHAA